MRLRRRGRDDLTCRQAVDLVTEYLDGALTPAERVRLEEHLAGCPHCSEYLAQLRAMITAAGRVDAGALEEPVRQELVALFRRVRP